MKMIKMMIVMLAMMMGGVALGDIVDGTCKKTHDYNFCVSLLHSDPHSSSANLTGLTLILVDKIKVHGIKTLEHIDKIYKTKPLLKRPLDKCIDAYKFITFQGIHDAINALSGRGYPVSTVNSLIYYASVCEEGFSKGQSPLASFSQRMFKICDIAKGVAAMLRN